MIGDDNGSNGTAIELVSGSALQALTRAEVDMQIATAKKYPRNLSRVVARATELATFSLDMAESCFYRLVRRGEGGREKVIEGPSIRMAEIILSSWGNLRAGSRIVDIGDQFLTAQGVVHDLENNVLVTKETQRRITTKHGKRYGDDMIVVTANAAASIALRNATFSVIPRAVASEVEAAIKAKMEKGGFGSLEQLRERMVVAFGKLGVKPDELERHLQKKVSAISMVDVMEMRRVYTTINDGLRTVEQVFRGAPIDDRDDAEVVGDTAATASDALANSLGGNGNDDSEIAVRRPAPAAPAGNGDRTPHPRTGLKAHRGDAGKIRDLLDAPGKVSDEMWHRALAKVKPGATLLADVDAASYENVLVALEEELDLAAEAARNA